MKLTNTLAAAALLSLSSIGMADGLEIDCQAPPQGASKEVSKCYSTACTSLKANLETCDGDAICNAGMVAAYLIELAACNLMAQPTTSDMLVFTLGIDGEWRVVWPGEIYEDLSVSFKFRI